LYRLEFEGDGLHREGFLKLQLKVGDAPEAYFRLIERTPVHMGEDAIGQAIATNATTLIPDAQVGGLPGEYEGLEVRTIIVTPIVLNGIHYGVLLAASLRETVPMGTQETSLFESVARRFERSLERAAHVEELTQTREMALRSLGLGLEIRDLEPKGHTDRVVALATQLGQRLRFADLEGLRLGAYLHDFGKLAVPEQVMQKAGILDTGEWRMMKTHPEVAFELLHTMPFLSQTARNVVRYHHERWDGSGYPLGLVAEEIPFEARLFAVVDVYDTLCHSRPYKTAWPPDRVRSELQEQAGKTLDPRVVGELLEYLRESRLE
jgi:HD-GYP domain-containing protein (c-di-GMP phosphodiesterase class II)